MKFLHIAIDGPVGSGKSFIAEELAKQLGITYIYTGAMYRAFALACYRQNVAFKDIANVLSLLKTTVIDFLPPDVQKNRSFTVLLNGEDVTEQVFDPIIDQGASDVSTIPEVRVYMVKRQQEMAASTSVVMEGRDIGLRVLPNAEFKIYLTASVEVRAKRRLEQFEKKGIQKTVSEVIQDTILRDTQDTTRSTDPLQKLPDAWELDTSSMTTEEVLAKITEELHRRSLL